MPNELNSYKNNHRSEGIRVANARTKVIIFVNPVLVIAFKRRIATMQI